MALGRLVPLRSVQAGAVARLTADEQVAASRGRTEHRPRPRGRHCVAARTANAEV